MTDRASAEGLPGYWTLREMRYHPDLKDKSPDYVAGWDAATRTLLALRDTGSRPDSGGDIETLERAFVRVIDQRPMKVEVTYYYGDTIPVEVQREAFLRDVITEYARLSTPRTETSDDA